MIRLKELRERNNYTQQTIADLLGITRAAYSNIENGKRQLGNDDLILIAQHYQVSLDYLLGITDNPDREKNTELSSEEGWVISIYRGLSAEGKFEVDRFLEYAQERYKKDHSISNMDAK